jgi:hypothetical protein
VSDELKKSVIIEGVASTPDRDIQGETLDIAGADITDLKNGFGFANSDHASGFTNLVGRVIDADKIMRQEDCKTPFQKKEWEKRKKPFIWTKNELWDGHGHKEADSIASIYKFYQSKGEEAPIRLSVEGKTLERGPGGLLKKTKIRGVAITVAPANRQTRTEVVGMLKNEGYGEDFCDSLVKSENHSTPAFVECESGFEKILELAVTARDLIKMARASGDPQPRLNSAELLKRLKALKGSA